MLIHICESPDLMTVVFRCDREYRPSSAIQRTVCRSRERERSRDDLIARLYPRNNARTVKSRRTVADSRSIFRPGVIR